MSLPGSTQRQKNIRALFAQPPASTVACAHLGPQHPCCRQATARGYDSEVAEAGLPASQPKSSKRRWPTLGAKVRIVAKTAERGTTSRALAVQTRTLELYRQLDLADAVVRGESLVGGEPGRACRSRRSART
jgi:hypothetical protein